MIKVFEAFAGYGSQHLAFKRLKADFEIVGISEIDKYAIKAYEALHGTLPTNYGDISKIDWAEVPDFDLFTYSFPCQAISIVGQRQGLDEGSGTESSLLWECKKAIEIKKPKILLMENVKNLVGRKNKPNFDKWLQYLESLGYTNYWKVINAKNCGIPQNRERVFCFSFLDGRDYTFPDETQMKSLEDLGIPAPIYHFAFGEKRIYNEYCPTLTRSTGGGHIPSVLNRQLTPYECGLLMGLTPKESERLCASGLSKTRLYNCLGNSIVVDILVMLFKPIVKSEVE
jgi:DNA (cytosine-5)-methyltransferase 1